MSSITALIADLPSPPRILPPPPIRDFVLQHPEDADLLQAMAAAAMRDHWWDVNLRLERWIVGSTDPEACKYTRDLQLTGGLTTMLYAVRRVQHRHQEYIQDFLLGRHRNCAGSPLPHTDFFSRPLPQCWCNWVIPHVKEVREASERIRSALEARAAAGEGDVWDFSLSHGWRPRK